MALKLTSKRQAELHDKMTAHLGQKVREAFEPPSLASRIYPNLKPAAEEEPRRGLVDGWAHLKGK
jgi:hypothetical protein